MQKQVAEIINNNHQDDRALIRELQSLHKEFGNAIYREALLNLVGKDFDNEIARHYWDEALAHREKILITDRIDSSLRPALLDYLHYVVGELDDPRIVEARDLADIRKSSALDVLTGLYNRTYFKAFLEKHCNQRISLDDPSCAVLLLDLDHFKQYNDRCGHPAGDKVLKQITKILLHCIRKGDVAARYGGEEFALLLTNVTRDQAYSIAERIRKVVDKASFQGQHLLDRGNLTISIGLSYMNTKQDSPDSLIEMANEELCRAKLFRNVVSPHQSENRKAARMNKNSIVEIALMDEPAFVPAMSRDVSPFGISLDCDRKVEMGTAIRLRFRHPFWPSNRQVVASVRHIDEHPGSGLFRLGLKFNPEQALSQTASMLLHTA